MAFPVKNRLVTAKIETTVGTDATPTVGSNAVRTSTADPGITLETLAIEQQSGSLDNNQQVANGGFMAPNVTVALTGSGTGGDAPDYDPLLQACAMGVTTLGTAVTDTAQGGTASTLQLAASDVSADGDYVGMIIELTGGTGYSASDAKQNRRVITASVASTDTVTVYPDWTVTPDATSTYTIPVCVVYAPISTATKAISFYQYARGDSAEDAILYKSLGTRGTWSLNLPTRGAGQMTFSLRGSLQQPADVTDPGAPTLLTSTPPSWLNAQTYLGGSSVCMGAFTADYGGQVVVTQCQNEIYGYESAAISERRIVGTINPRTVNIATRDIFSQWAAGTSSKYWSAWGPSAGNRVSIYIPQFKPGGVTLEDVDGFSNDSIPWLAGGQDGDTIRICYF